MGYYALKAGSIPIAKGRRMAGLFFVSGATYILSNITFSLGPAFYFMYYVVPSGFAVDQAASDYGLSNATNPGPGPGFMAVLCFLLAEFGIRGLFSVVKPWRLGFLIITVVGSLFAGFRSIVALIFLILFFQFYFEGFLRTRLLPVFVGIAVSPWHCSFFLPTSCRSRPNAPSVSCRSMWIGGAGGCNGIIGLALANVGGGVAGGSKVSGGGQGIRDRSYGDVCDRGSGPVGNSRQ